MESRRKYCTEYMGCYVDFSHRASPRAACETGVDRGARSRRSVVECAAHDGSRGTEKDRCVAAQWDLHRFPHERDKCAQLRRSTAPVRHTKSARSVRFRCSVLSRRNLLRGDETGPPHKIWYSRRHNNWCADAVQCRLRCAKVPLCCIGRARSPRESSSFLSRE